MYIVLGIIALSVVIILVDRFIFGPWVFEFEDEDDYL